ncbi:hypothetical protein L2E82_29331 [Cichorium intybus]|uniref:Uncharacterized protein n=1 Tax=Cichorium intybus TaxID=13427 RepID=A0ACB9CXD7_CICIN|nr:hypothetical protein L2E82_29331 [Cichorium intybus]
MSFSEINLEKYRIPLEEIIQATKYFSSESQIGDGGFDRIDMSSFNTFNKIAHECINLDSKKRPTTDRIIDEIEKALKIQLDHICCRDFTDTVNNEEDGFPANNDDITSTVELDTVDDRNNDLPPSDTIRPFKKQKTYKVPLNQFELVEGSSLDGNKYFE